MSAEFHIQIGNVDGQGPVNVSIGADGEITHHLTYVDQNTGAVQNVMHGDAAPTDDQTDWAHDSAFGADDATDPTETRVNDVIFTTEAGEPGVTNVHSEFTTADGRTVVNDVSGTVAGEVRQQDVFTGDIHIG